MKNNPLPQKIIAERCRRSNGTERAWFHTKEEAEAFANDPANHPIYLGDIAHFCTRCGMFHLSRPEWLHEQALTQALTWKPS